MLSVARRAALRRGILAWYDLNARALPWRVGPEARAAGVRPDPYRVWLSEIMLQQTTVPHATPYFLAFVRRWPTVADLARAEDAEVMGAWAGLGYYARARNLLTCARKVAAEMGGRFPQTQAALAELPGVGPYTAAAITAIAFDRAANVVDGNVERVVARLFASEAPLPAGKPELRRLAGLLAGPERPGDWAQALMDLGAMVCSPTAPDCGRCPAAADCRALAAGAPGRYPLRAPRPERPLRHGAAFVLTRGTDVALVRRPPRGLLGGMLGLPTSPWRPAPLAKAEVLAAAPVAAPWVQTAEVRHVFTHFALELSVFRAEGDWPDALWTPREGLSALPSVFLKAARAALALPPQDRRRRA